MTSVDVPIDQQKTLDPAITNLVSTFPAGNLPATFVLADEKLLGFILDNDSVMARRTRLKAIDIRQS